MTLKPEQVEYIKKQLLKQTEKFPEDKKKEAEDYINSMTDEEVEAFLKKNQAMAKESSSDSGSGNAKKPAGTDCIYCLVANKQMESLSIYEDKDYLAALEINPFSEGHIILMPKKHIKETKALKAKAFSVANKIGKHLVKQLKAENFQISSSDDMKHAIINIIPTYQAKTSSPQTFP